MLRHIIKRLGLFLQIMDLRPLQVGFAFLDLWIVLDVNEMSDM